MCKQPVRSYSGRAATEGEKESRRFLRLRDNILRYDTADTLSISQSESMSPVVVSATSSDGPNSEEHSQTAPAAPGMFRVQPEKNNPPGNPTGNLLPEPLFTPSVSFTASIPDTPTPGPVTGTISSHLSSITDKLTDRLFNKTPAKHTHSAVSSTPGRPLITPSRGRSDTLAAVMGAFSGYGKWVSCIPTQFLPNCYLHSTLSSLLMPPIQSLFILLFKLNNVS